MEHFTIDQTCKHGGCEMAIMFWYFHLLPSKASHSSRRYKKNSGMPKHANPDHLVLLSLDLATSLDALQNVLTILVQLQLGDDDLGGVDTDGD